MWTRKELKSRAKSAVRRNYWSAVAVCFLLAIFVGAHSFFNSRLDPSGHPRSNFQAPTNSEIVDNLIGGITGDEGPAEDEAVGTKATKGLFALVFNNSTRAGSFLFGSLNALNQMIFHDNISAGFIIILGVLISLAYWLFAGNILRIGECRFFMENRLYHGSTARRVLFLYKLRRLKNAVMGMLKKTVLVVLWSFTIAGGFIKAYSYRMVPYILAENPDIDSKTAFSLSEQMMRGHKWSAFLLDISFLPWYLLSMCTFGILAFLYVSPYKAATDAELYMALRQNAQDGKLEHSGYLSDKYLTAKPEEDAGAEQYPVALFTIAEHPKSKWLSVDCHRKYSVWNLIVFFFAFSFGGWLWEVSLYLFTDGVFVNRGFLFGPWLPVYGCGSIFILLLLRKFVDKPALIFLLSFAICGVVEYTTGWYLETFRGMKWWDYSGYMLNLQGRVCLERLILFGLCGFVGIYLIAPVLDDLLNKIPGRIKKAAIIVLLALFATDVAYSMQHPNVGDDITSSVSAPRQVSERYLT